MLIRTLALLALLLLPSVADAQSWNPRLVIAINPGQADAVFDGPVRVIDPQTGKRYTAREVIGGWNWALVRIAAIEVQYHATPTFYLSVSRDGQTGISADAAGLAGFSGWAIGQLQHRFGGPPYCVEG